MTEAPGWVKGPKLEAAFALADRAHAGEHRKGKPEEPYINHLVNVAGMVRGFGGNEDQVCAALLHDAIEDTGVADEHLRDAISAEVARIVRACTDTETGDTAHPGKDKMEWKAHKARYHGRLAATPDNDAALLVSLCDKIDNAEDSARDIGRLGAVAFWNQKEFNAGGSCQHWNYTTLLGIYRQKLTDPRAQDAVARLERAVEAMFSGEIPPCTSTTHSH
ncbi:MAG: HD domain-containing protein [Acidimicrobiales bacterium]